MLNLAIGTPVTFGEREFIRTRTGVSGHAVFGPYLEVEPGSYLVEFSATLAENEIVAADSIYALIDVVADMGQTDIVFDFVTGRQLSDESESIFIAFDLQTPTMLEFRFYTSGVVALLVGDEPVLRKRDVNENLIVAVPDRHARSLRSLLYRSIPIEIADQDVVVTVARSAIGDLFGPGDATAPEMAREIAERVAFKGDHENRLYRAFIGTDQPIISPPREIPFTSTLCHQAHFAYDQYRFWSRAMKEEPKFYRKQWEFVYIAQSLFERGLLAPGKRGVVFGAGQEQLPALFASFGAEILATDQAADDAARSGWVATGQHTFDLSALNQRGICTAKMFSELVSFRAVDMNAIPQSLDESFDFCWSACALEHLGSLEHGLQFIENSILTLRPGGVAVHTTEFNLSSNDDTFESESCSFYRRCDMEAVVSRLTEKGYLVSPFDWTIGEGFAELVVDLPPYGRGEPHIRLRAGDYDCTSVGLIVERPL
ncbi:hypothetical protein ACSBM8_15860 [Sphingomonas sp. ASY06-1R]|uniref:hypothetical protein n=1 Tax=Sphingomonas sp. ASY06-1R TaxID=3445771 RepID=UPI003FA2DE81